MLRGGGLEVEVVEDVPSHVARGSLDEWWETVVRHVADARQVLERVRRRDGARIRAGAERRLGATSADGSLAVPGLARVALAVRR